MNANYKQLELKKKFVLMLNQNWCNYNSKILSFSTSIQTHYTKL